MANRDWSEELRDSLARIPDREPNRDLWPAIRDEIRDGERGSAAVRGRPWLVAAAVAGFAAALLGLWLAARSSVVETSPLPKVAKAQPAQTQLLLLEQALDETAAALELEGDDRFLREYLAKLERRRERYLQSAARWGVTP